MEEILAQLKSGERVLDLGSRFGSFDAALTSATTIRLDLEPAWLQHSVCADAARLPFRDRSFAAVIANHSLEHVEQLDSCLAEIGRVLARDGALYVAVPDASTLCDRLYRWLARGGGHVNAVVDAPAFARKVESLTGLPLVAQRILRTSYSYLNEKNVGQLSLKMRLLGGGQEPLLRQASRWMRLLDRRFGWRTTVYGWALYFGRVQAGIDTTERWNVCVRCGSGHEGRRLDVQGDCYRCPGCGTRNIYLSDERRPF